MKILVTLALYGAALGSLFSGQTDVVDVGYARYLGNRSYDNTVAYLGVPYAEPPLGELRFRAPLPLNTTRMRMQNGGALVDATAYPDFCIQGTIGSGDAGGAGSEDCLKVNVYAPAGVKKGSNLPVLVYIHGGGYVYGNPRNWPFEHWIHQSPNVVIVSVYYRLDAFGFLSAPSFAFASTTSALSLGTHNAGFLDQREALRWVQKNIGAFGGDPARVTIDGESAGGSSIELHLVARGAESERLFSGAIAQSVYRTPLPTPAEQKPLFDYFASAAGCGTSTDAQKMACLRKASVSAIARAQDQARYNFTGAYKLFHPVLDGEDFVEYPTNSLLHGRFKDVPLIVGSTSNETLSSGTNISASLTTFFPNLRSQDIQALENEYPAAEFASGEQRAGVITGESELICARSIMGTAWAGEKKSKVFAYRYDQRVPGSTQVNHAAENWMMFLGTSTGTNGTTTFNPQTPTEQAFAAELIAYWLSFVRSGDPSTYRLAAAPKWPPYTVGENTGRARVALRERAQNGTVGSGSVVEVEPREETRRCAVVAGLAEWQQA